MEDIFRSMDRPSATSSTTGMFRLIKETTAPVSQARIDMKDWADIILCDNVFRRMLPELQKVYCQADAQKLYCRSESTYTRVAKAGD